MLGAGPPVELLHDMFVKLNFFQGYEFELQLLCIEIWSEIVLQGVQHLSARLHSMQLDVPQARSIIDK